LTVVLILEYFHTRYRLKKILGAADMLGYNFGIKDAFLSLWYDSRELFLVLNGSYTAYANSGATKDEYINSLKESIENMSHKGNEYINKLSSYSLSLSEEGLKYILNPSTPMYLYIPHTDDTKYITKNYTPYQAFAVVVLFL